MFLVIFKTETAGRNGMHTAHWIPAAVYPREGGDGNDRVFRLKIGAHGASYHVIPAKLVLDLIGERGSIIQRLGSTFEITKKILYGQPG